MVAKDSNPGRTNSPRVGYESNLIRRLKSFHAMWKNNWFDLFSRLRNPIVDFVTRFRVSDPCFLRVELHFRFFEKHEAQGGYRRSQMGFWQQG